jgi:hypothetical protein
MVQMDVTVKLFMIALVGVFVGAIVLYHVWLDGRLAREHGARPGQVPTPASRRAEDLTG